MTNIDILKDQALAAALNHAAFDGWSDALFNRVSAEIEVNPALLREAFPNGIVDIISYHSQQADEVMIASIKADADFTTLKIREKIAHAVMLRLEAHKNEREAIRKAAHFLAVPWRASYATKVLYHTVDAIWRAAGDTSMDFNFYTKRATLAGIYLPTLHVWFDDNSADLHKTREFLNRRIENVMQFEKFKAKCREKKEYVKSWLPDSLKA